MGRKSVAFPIGACFRAACNHPFVMVMVCFLAVLYRSFPYVFSLLVSAFPIIFCTGVLLGALLSFSQQKAPKIKGGEEEIIDRAVAVAVALKTEISNDASVQRQVVSSEDDTSREDDIQEIQFGRSEREFHIAGFELLNKEDGDGLLLKDHCLPIPKLGSENFEVEIDKSVGSCDSKLVNIGSPPCLGSPAKHENEDEEILDSGSDQAGSCSVAEIVPMLDDELHPLLDEDAPPRPVNLLSQDGSDVTSEHFSRSNDSSTESDDSIEEKNELQVEDEDKEVTKSAIKWTEEDEKNMMEVGSSELERNQLLESVMARRRSRKWMSMMNLEKISGPPIPIVTTKRQNPFDTLPDSCEEEEGLPPIPGSAPSILVPRRNPFDIPYYSNEEEHKSDLSGQNSGLDFFDFQPKETTTFFQGSEFLNVGPSSIFGLSKQDKQDVSCESSYFPPAEEQMAPEGTSYSTGVHTHQSNGPANSKLSSEEENLEDKNVIKEDIEKEKVDVGDMEEKKLIDEEHMFEEEAVLISKIEHASENVGHGSESSTEEEEEEECVGGLKNILVDEIVMKTENHGEFNSELESVQQRYSNASSSSSSSSSSPTSSEVSQRMFDEKEEKAAANFVERRSSSSSSCGAANGILRRQTSVDGSELSLVEEGGQRREPVYDSSPPRLNLNLRRNFSSSSLDMHESSSWFPPIQVKRTVSFAEGVIMMGSNNRGTEMSIPSIKEMLDEVVSKSFPDASNNSSVNSQPGDIKHLQDHHQLSEADTQHSLNQTDYESTSKSSSSADQEAQDKSPR